MKSSNSPWAKAFGLIAGGVGCLALGTLWGRDFPVIKILWTSTYVVIAAGWSLVLLGLFYAIIDVLKVRFWAYFFVVIGVNAITIYMLSRIVPFDEIARFFFITPHASRTAVISMSINFMPMNGTIIPPKP